MAQLSALAKNLEVLICLRLYENKTKINFFRDGSALSKQFLLMMFPKQFLPMTQSSVN
jgi:hypothetical protein